jgi:hypothetical protein
MDMIEEQVGATALSNGNGNGNGNGGGDNPAPSAPEAALFSFQSKPSIVGRDLSKDLVVDKSQVCYVVLDNSGSMAHNDGKIFFRHNRNEDHREVRPEPELFYNQMEKISKKGSPHVNPSVVNPYVVNPSVVNGLVLH